MRIERLASLLVAWFLLAACAAPAAQDDGLRATERAATSPAALTCRDGQPALVASLFFGRGRHDGTPINEAEWRDFLARDVTPLFPDGLTVLDGIGQWRAPGETRIGRERSTLVIIAAPDTETVRAGLTAVRNAYRRRFAQRSVGLIIQPGCAEF